MDNYKVLIVDNYQVLITLYKYKVLKIYLLLGLIT